MTAAINFVRCALIASNRGPYDRQLDRWASLSDSAEADPDLNTWVSYLDEVIEFGGNDAVAAYGELCIIYGRLGWGWPTPPEEALPWPLSAPQPTDSVFTVAERAIGPAQGYYPDGV